MTGSIGAMMAAGLGLALFVPLLVWAAWGDVRRYIIPNRISLLILAAYLPFSSAAAFLPEFYPSVNWFSGLMTGGAVLLVGFLLFAMGLIGGGDVKLLSSVSVWAGPALIFPLLMATALTGGLLATAMLIAQRQRQMTRRRGRPPAADTAAAEMPSLPYGVAIAAGGLLVAGQLAAALRGAAL